MSNLPGEKPWIKYDVEVSGENGLNIYWTLNGEKHCEHGPAVFYADGTWEFYLYNEWMTQEEWEGRTGRAWSRETKSSHLKGK